MAILVEEPLNMSWDLQIILYWALVLVVSVLLHALAQRSAKANTVSGFLSYCLVISAVCGAINLVDLIAV
jgi:hypothetical protein